MSGARLPLDGVPANVERDEIFQRLFRSVRDEVPTIPSDPSLADPALVVLLKALAAELSEVQQKVRESGECALDELVRRLIRLPRGPRPAQTVLRYEVVEPGIRVGPNDAVTCTVPRRAGGELKEVRLEFRPRFAAVLGEHAVVATAWVTARGEARLRVMPPPGAAQRGIPDITWNTVRSPRPFVLFCLETRVDQPTDERPAIFVGGPTSLVRSILWGRWRAAVEADRTWLPGEQRAPDLTPAIYVPAAVTEEAEEVLSFRSDRGGRWGLFETRFVRLPLTDVPADQTPALLHEVRRELPASRGTRRWWRVDIAGDPEQDIGGVQFYSDCMPAENRKVERKERLVTDPTRQAIELPVKFTELADVVEVRDQGDMIEYLRSDGPEATGGGYTYRLGQLDGSEFVAVWIYRPSQRHDPSRVEVKYAVNSAELANDILPGSINQLLQPNPGVQSAVNLVETTGGRTALTDRETEEELRGVLRHHGRAITLQDYRDLAKALLQPFAVDVNVTPWVSLTPRGARRSVLVVATVKATKDDGGFVSELEEEVVRQDLEHRLGLKSPVGTHVEVRFRRG